MLSLGSIIYVILLLINAMAVLSEDRFLARSTYYPSLGTCRGGLLTGKFVPGFFVAVLVTVGWASTHVQAAQAAYAQPYSQPYEQPGGAQDVGVKGRLINLISAVRTLMRGAFLNL